MKKHLFLFFCLMLAGCATTLPKPPAPEEILKYTASFNYTPDSQAVPDSAGVIFTVAGLSFNAGAKDASPWFMNPQFENLHKAVAEDLSELLMANGFSVRGPFDSYDLIPFPDKKAIDLYLIPTMELWFTGENMKDDYDSAWLTSRAVTGNMVVTGKIILEAREIVSRELMWSKTIPIKKFEFPVEVHYMIGKPGGVIVQNKIMNETAKQLEKQYPDLMTTILPLIDPEEMRIIKKQAQELKSKKGY